MYPKTPLKNILKLFNWYAFKKTDYKESGILLVRQTNLDWNSISKNKAVYVDKKFLDEKKEFILKEWDILIWMSWNIWKYCFFDLKEPALQNQRVWKLSFSDKVYSKFVLYYLPIIENQLKEKAKWVAVLNISWKDLEEIKIPLPSLPTQHLIVQEIEKQFSRLDEWLASLKRTKENLKKYKASVLKSAVEWKLTEEWRNNYFNDSETSSEWQSAMIDINLGWKYNAKELLSQILQARKEKFLAENPWKKYKEPEAIKKEDLPNIILPEGWEYCKLEQIVWFLWSWITPKWWKNVYLDNWIKFIRSQNVYFNYIINDDIAYISDKQHNIMKRTKIKDLDVLLNITWASIWRTAVVPEWFWEANVNQHVCIIRPILLNPYYLCIYLASQIWQNLIMWIQKWVTRQWLNYEQIRNFPIPLPSLPEQNEIVKIVESKLSVVEKLEKIVNDNIRKAENLKHSILKKAFEGELVKES